MASTAREDERLIAAPSGNGAGDGDDDANDERRARRTSRRLFVGAVAVGGAVIAGVVWYLSQTPGGGDAEAPSQLPLLTADNEPVKVRPDDPGGIDIPNRDKYVYKSLEGAPPEQPVEQLLPAPEEPMAKPVETGPALQALDNVTTMDAAPHADQAAAEPDTSAVQPPPAASDGTQVVVNVEAPPAAPNAALEATASNTGPVDQARAEPDAASEPTPPKSGSADQVSAIPADQASAAPAKTIADLISADAGTGGVWLQLAALSDEASANAEWNRITKKHGGALGATQPRIERAELGARGVWYRVRIGPFANRADAKEACKKLAARGQACRIVQP